KIGDYVFCHAGISPVLARTYLSISDINRISRENLGKPDDEITDSLARIIFDTREGIFWYRGAAKNQLNEQEVNQILKFAGAKRIVIGHTLVPDVMALYDGRIVCVDLYHGENLRQGFVKTLYVEDGFMYTLSNKGEKESPFIVSFKDKSRD
ncbi:MAG: hypothetical protein L6Q97_24185, partial [Thermoanaerobaculia bacterium]|nr:hypothetical protein [Thermoanaerobaculia bacterium]